MSNQLQIPDNYIKKEKVSYLKSKIGLLNGVLYLTNNGLLLIANKTTIASGLLGRLLKKKVEEKKYGFNIELSQIKNINQGKHGLQSNVLEILDHQDNTYRIIVKSYKNWEQILKKQRRE